MNGLQWREVKRPSVMATWAGGRCYAMREAVFRGKSYAYRRPPFMEVCRVPKQPFARLKGCPDIWNFVWELVQPDASIKPLAAHCKKVEHTDDYKHIRLTSDSGYVVYFEELPQARA